MAMDALTEEAIKRLLFAGVGAAGLGVVTRGALGAARSFNSQDQEPMQQNRIVVPLPVMKQKQAPKRTAFGMNSAGGGMGELPGMPGEKMGNIFGGGPDAQTVGDMPGYLPALALTTLPAAYLGYKGMDAYLNNRERTGMKDQLDAARKRFRTSLVESLGPIPQTPKTALDQLTVSRTKVAGVMGMLGAGAAVAALLSGKMMYDAAASRSPSSVLAAAEKRRQREMSARTPPSIELQPTPVSMGRGGHVHVINPDMLGNDYNS